MGKAAEDEQGRASSTPRQGTPQGLPLLFSEPDQLLCEIMGSLEIASHEVAVPQSPQHRKQLGRSA